MDKSNYQSFFLTKWRNKIIEQLNEGKKWSYLISDNKDSKWFIIQLVKRNLPYELIVKGSGIRQFILKGKVCSNCKGKGFVI